MSTCATILTASPRTAGSHLARYTDGSLSGAAFVYLYPTRSENTPCATNIGARRVQLMHGRA